MGVTPGCVTLISNPPPSPNVTWAGSQVATFFSRLDLCMYRDAACVKIPRPVRVDSDIWLKWLSFDVLAKNDFGKLLIKDIIKSLK